MKNLSPTIINWFKQKIVEVYGSPEIKKTPLAPLVVWEKQSVPDLITETYREQTDDGVQSWVNIVFAGSALLALFLMSSVSLLSGGLVLGAGVLFFLYGKKNFRKIKEIVQEKKVPGIRVEKVKKEIPQFREEVIPGKWTIRRIGTGALKFGVGTANGTRFLCGIDFSEPLQHYHYAEIGNAKKFIADFNHLEEQLATTPFVLSGDKECFDTSISENQNIPVPLRGLEKEIMNHFIETEYAFALYKNREVHVSLIKENIVKNILKKTSGIFSPYEDDLLAVLQEGEELDHACGRWLDSWSEWNQILKDVRTESVNGQIIPEFIRFSNQTHYSSFNFYCPDCNQEISDELMRRDYSVHNDLDLPAKHFSKDTRCHYLLDRNAWQCPLCEKIQQAPIPVHKALDEILLPLYNNLMQENKTEREKEYFDVRKKEIHYKNEKRKELEKMYYDNVSGILELRESMEKMKAEIDGESEAIRFINDSLMRYKNLQSDIITDIKQSNEAIQVQVQELQQKILADVDRIRGRELELLSGELTELSKARRLDDEIRDSVQLQILKKIEDKLKSGNAIHAARNEDAEADSYDNSYLLRPVHTLKREAVK
ncbi:MAG: hypothetical protein ABFD10_15885 [Prolixibacteraceae bacterium]